MDDNELIAPEDLGNSGESEIKSKSNGVCHVEDGNDKLLEDIKIMGTIAMSPSETVTKRPGLRKWRRIPRELAKNPCSNIDGRKNGHLTPSLVKVNGNSTDSKGDIGLGDQPVLATRADSTNSDEQSSRPLSAPTLGISVHSGDQQKNGRSGTSKKARGFKIEKENSLSNMGSDSRSSNFVFVQGTNSVASKGRHSGGSAKYYEDYCDDAYFADKQLNNDAGSEDVSQEDVDVKEEKIGKHEGSLKQAALVESITIFNSAVEELEKEVQKWKDIGKDEPLIFDDSLLEVENAAILELKSDLTCGDSQTEVEDIWKEKIQAELEILAITTTTKTMITGPLHLQQKQEPLQDMQAEKLDTTDDVKKQQNRVCVPSHDKKLETEEDVKKLQYRMFRLSSCLMIQLILFVTLYLEFSSQNVGLVPT